MPLRLALGLALLVSLGPTRAAAQGLFMPSIRAGEPLLSSVPMIRDLRALRRGRALEPAQIRRVARRGPASPTRERMVERMVRERDDERRAVYARELLRVAEPSHERAFVGAFSRASGHSAGILSRALEYFGTKAAVDALVRGLGRAPTAEAAEDALVSLGGRVRGALVAAAEEGARAPGLARALGRIGATRARPILFAKAMGPDPVLARAAGMALVLLDPANERARAEALVTALPEGERRRFLREWYARDPAAALSLVTPDDLEDRRLALTLAVSGELSRGGVELLHRAASPALAAVASASSASGRRALLATDSSSSSASAILLAAARADDPEEREALLEKIDKAELGELAIALADPSREYSVSGLFRGLAEGETFAAAALLLAEPMRRAGPTARQRHLAALFGGLRSDDVRVRVGACIALSELSDRGAVVALARALDDEEPSVRFAAAVALASIGGSEARTALDRAIRVEVDPVAREALEAARARRPRESELGRAMLGEEGVAIPNAVILFASGAGIAY